MAVIKEWHCNGCGAEIESAFPVCGRCGASEPHVVRAFRTAPGFKGDKTKVLDTSLQNFTKQYGLTDFSNNPSTKHEKNFDSLWRPAGDLVKDPSLVANAGEAALIKSIGKDAAAPIGKNKIIVGKEAVAR